MLNWEFTDILFFLLHLENTVRLCRYIFLTIKYIMIFRHNIQTKIEVLNWYIRYNLIQKNSHYIGYNNLKLIETKNRENT